jgi:FkbM family methyltransferase
LCGFGDAVTTIKFLKKLKALGFNPANILDIGAHWGRFGEHCISVFKKANIMMVEPIKYKELKKSCQSNQFSCRNVLLDECEQMRDWHEMRDTGDSMYKEKTRYYENCAIYKRKTTTLDVEFRGYFSSGPELIKIDTQGAEIPILKGGKETIRNNEIIIMEVPLVGSYNENAPNFSEYISYLDDAGYTPLELLKPGAFCYREVTKCMTDGADFSIHTDIAFIKKGHKLLDKQQAQILELGKRTNE